jgi:hypothetical protein
MRAAVTAAKASEESSEFAEYCSGFELLTGD